MTLDPDVAALLDATRAAGVKTLAELSPSELRERVSAGDQTAAGGPELGRVTAEMLPAGLAARRYEPNAVRTDTPIVWFHGGGWTSGDLNYSDGFCRLLADGVRAVVHSINYRLAPEHPFPAAVEDAVSAVQTLARRGPVIVAGDSAGGNLAAVCAQSLRAEVRGQLLVYPVVDTDITTGSYQRNAGIVLGPAEMTWFFDRYLPNPADRTSPRAAPLRAASLAGSAPAVVVVAGYDPLYDEGVAYAEALRQADVAVTLLDFPDLVHGFLRFTGPVPAAAAAARRIVDAAAGLI